MAANIIDVTESDFEFEVMAYSQNLPVVVDFWASWCRPCKTLGPLLESITREAEGAFRLARVDVDANPTLALRFSVRSIPTVKAFSGAQVVSEFVGLIPEERLREFISKITPPSPLTLALEKAESLLAMHQWAAAEKMFRDLIGQYPDHGVCTFGLVKALLAQNKNRESLEILRNFPPSKQYAQAQKLLPYAEAARDALNGTLPEENELDAAFHTAVRLAGRGNLEAALDGLIDILRRDRNHRGGRTRLVILSLLDIMGDDNESTRQYRSELASVLF